MISQLPNGVERSNLFPFAVPIVGKQVCDGDGGVQMSQNAVEIVGSWFQKLMLSMT